jgi:molybdopterin-guanine dinucleotide biosynthesis protein MobB
VVELPLVIQVVGSSGSGKTLVVEHCVRRLTLRGLRVGVVKHSHHTPDLRGKDSARFSSAGASVVVFSGPVSFVVFRSESEESLRALPVDVVLVEGYSTRRLGSHRYEISAPAQAPGIVSKILRVCPRTTRAATVVLDGRRSRADPQWEFVVNLMRVRGVREVRSGR